MSELAEQCAIYAQTIMDRDKRIYKLEMENQTAWNTCDAAEQRYRAAEAKMDRVNKAKNTMYSKGNAAWVKDRPDLTEAYNVCGDLVQAALQDQHE